MESDWIVRLNYRTWLYIWVTRRVSYKKQELPEYLSLRSEFRGFLHKKRCSVRLYIQLFVYVICVCLRIVVSNTYCVGLLFFIVFKVWILCCPFLWIVHLWLLSHPLTFIYYTKMICQVHLLHEQLLMLMICQVNWLQHEQLLTLMICQVNWLQHEHLLTVIVCQVIYYNMNNY
jgi:hypothetical protein